MHVCVGLSLMYEVYGVYEDPANCGWQHSLGRWYYTGKLVEHNLSSRMACPLQFLQYFFGYEV